MKAAMRATISAKRKGDALITIRQDNIKKQIEILKMNLAAEKLTGFPASELIGQKIDRILPVRIRDTLAGYVEFGDSNSDFASVARRIPNFQIRQKNGKEIPASLKVFDLVPEDANHLEYEILMRDVTLIKRMTELKAQLADNQSDEAIDPDTGLPSVGVVQDSLIMAYNFVEQDPIEVTFASVAIDEIGYYAETYGEGIAYEIVKAVAAVAKKTCRDEDIIGYLDSGELGLILLDCNADNAKSVLTRFNKNVLGKPINLSNGEELQVTLSMAFVQLSPEYDIADMYNATRESVTEAMASGGNVILSVV